jgi:hypothetical protein
MRQLQMESVIRLVSSSSRFAICASKEVRPLVITSTAARLDYEAPAELFIARTGRKLGAVRFHRLDKASEAICSAIEELLGTTMRTALTTWSLVPHR